MRACAGSFVTWLLPREREDTKGFRERDSDVTGRNRERERERERERDGEKADAGELESAFALPAG